MKVRICPLDYLPIDSSNGYFFRFVSSLTFIARSFCLFALSRVCSRLATEREKRFFPLLTFLSSPFCMQVRYLSAAKNERERMGSPFICPPPSQILFFPLRSPRCPSAKSQKRSPLPFPHYHLHWERGLVFPPLGTDKAPTDDDDTPRFSHVTSSGGRQSWAQKKANAAEGDGGNPIIVRPAQSRAKM